MMNSRIPNRGWQLSLFVLVGGMGLLGRELRAAVEIFQVDSARSALALQGSVSGAELLEQGTGSLTTTFHGYVVADLEASTIQLLQGSTLVADQTNSWQPGAHGSPAPAPAGYGAKATIGKGITAVDAVAAIRNLSFDLSSPAIAVQNGQFEVAGVALTIPSAPNASLDYRANGLVVTTGNRALRDLSAIDISGSAALALVAEVQTLTLPVDVTLTCQMLSPGDTVLHFTGQLVARRGVDIVRPQLLWIPPGTNAALLTLVWASPYKLQRTPSLSAPVWTDFATNAPFNVAPEGGAGFFRVVTP